MTKKKFVQFGDVVGEKKEDEEVKIKVKSGKSIVDEVLDDHKGKEETHTFKGYWLENEVAETIDELTKKKQKGAKSALVNKILKDYFISEDLL